MSKPPYVQEFPQLGITSIVLDEVDFNAFVDELLGIVCVNNDQRTTDEHITRLKEAKHLSLMSRGTKTEQFFLRWGVKTDKLSVIVRGHGKEVAKQLFGGG